MVAEGMDWELIVHQWNGKVTREAIAEAVTLAAKALLQRVHEYTPEPID
jgi:negative regulator of sigma E activity